MHHLLDFVNIIIKKLFLSILLISLLMVIYNIKPKNWQFVLSAFPNKVTVFIPHLTIESFLSDILCCRSELIVTPYCQRVNRTHILCTLFWTYADCNKRCKYGV